MADHDRILELFKAHPGEYYPTFRIAELIGAQDNSVQRGLHTLRHKMGINITSRPYKDTMVRSYTIGEQPPIINERKKYDDFHQREQPCVCGSWWINLIGGVWTCRCGVAVEDTSETC